VFTAVGKEDQQVEARFWVKSTAPELPTITSTATMALQQELRALRPKKEPAAV
jgi:hypothetical protein